VNDPAAPLPREMRDHSPNYKLGSAERMLPFKSKITHFNFAFAAK